MKKFALDIFSLLKRIDDPTTGDIYTQLSPEEIKSFSALITMRWMSGTSDEQQIMMLNEFVNPAVYPLMNHPQLLMQLLQVASSKTPKRYKWFGIKLKKKKEGSIKVVKEYFDISDREVRVLNPFPTDEEIIQMAESLGWQFDEVKKLKKELEET